MSDTQKKFSSVRVLIFDLDGTLIDSKLDLAHSVNAMLEHMGRAPLPHDTIYSYVGNGAPVLVRRALGEGATEAEAKKAWPIFSRIIASTCSTTPSRIRASAKVLALARKASAWRC